MINESHSKEGIVDDLEADLIRVAPFDLEFQSTRCRLVEFVDGDVNDYDTLPNKDWLLSVTIYFLLSFHF